MKIKPLRFNLLTTFATYSLFTILTIMAYHLANEQMDISPYFYREIERTIALLNGNIPILGSDTIGGGFTSGPLFYILLAPVVAISSSYQFVILCFISAWLTSKLILVYLLKKHFDVPKYLSLSFIIFSFHILTSQLRSPTNATFLEILFPIPLYLCIHFWKPTTTTTTTTTTTRRWVFFSITIALLTQIHFSFLIFILYGLILNGFFQKKTLAYFLISLSILTAAMVFYFFYSYHCTKYHTCMGFEGVIGKDAIYLVKNRYPFAVSKFFSNINSFGHWRLVLIPKFTLVLFTLIYFIKNLSRRTINIDFKRRLNIANLIVFILMFPYITFYSLNRYISLVILMAFVHFTACAWESSIVKKFNPFIAVLCVIFGLANLQLNRTYLAEGQFLSQYDINPICNYFNKTNVSFNTFRFHTFEVHNIIDNENSFYIAKNCFQNLKGGIDRLNNRFLIINNENLSLFKTGKLIFPPEVSDLYLFSKGKLEFQTKNYSFFSFSNIITRPGVYFTNLTHPYEVDSVLLKQPIGNSILNLSPQNGKSTHLYTANICPYSPICNIFALVTTAKNQHQIIFYGRIFQSKWELPPLVAQLKDVSYSFNCDGKNYINKLISTLGVAESSKQNSSFNAPIVAYSGLKCQSFELLQITAKESFFENKKSALIKDGSLNSNFHSINSTLYPK